MYDEGLKNGITVVICCYNSESKLPITIDYISQQKVPEYIHWEVIIIDNASTDNTKYVAQKECRDKLENIRYKIVDQPIKGLTAARDKGFKLAQYEFVLFCDDDNWLDRDYIRNAYDLMAKNGAIGILGGEGDPVSDVKIPDWFYRFSARFAVGPQGTATGDVTDTRGWVYGAGFIIRKSVWSLLKKNGFANLLTGRDGKGQDKEMCFAVRLAGYRIWYDNQLTFKHYIPEQRLKWKNVLNLVELQHYAAVVYSAYSHVLNKNNFQYVRPSNFYWIKKSFSIIRELASGIVLKIIILSFFKDLEDELVGNFRIARYRRTKGELISWLRSGVFFVKMCNKLHLLKIKTQNQKKENIELSSVI